MRPERIVLQRSGTARPTRRGHTHAARAFLYRAFVVSPKRCGSLIRFSILRRTTWISSRYKAAIAQAEGDLPQASALLAPLRPNADDPIALEIQVYQAILERRPAPVISRLKEILAKPDPGLGFYNGELRFWLGWAQEVGGDHAAAQESWRQARSELEPFLKEQPENYLPMGDLAVTNMALGDKTAAFALAEQAMAASRSRKTLRTVPFRSRSSLVWQRKWENPTAPSLLYGNFYRHLMKAPSLKRTAAHSRAASARSNVRSAPG